MSRFLSLGFTIIFMTLGVVAFAQGSQASCKKIEMVKVPGGVFSMGATAEQGSDLKDSEPVHVITLTSFQIGKYEVTQKQWEEVMGYNHSTVRRADLPVTGVSWNEVQTFIGKLNKMTGKNYRLPTEAEWEFAARGGLKTMSKQYSGGSSILDVACFSENSTQPVTGGSFKANELGICDMSGNVMEWCHDYYAPYTFERLTDPEGPTEGRERVLRGGSYQSSEKACRTSCRSHDYPSSDNAGYGFRLVLSSHKISGYEAAEEPKQTKSESKPVTTSVETTSSNTTTTTSTGSTQKIRYTYNLFTINAAYNVTHGIPKSFNRDNLVLGLRYGQYKRAGMYINVMANLNFNGYGTLYSEQDLYTGETSLTRASATIGLILKLCNPLALYAGAGFGYRSVNWKTLDGKWHRMAPGSLLGYDVDMGLLLNLGGFALTFEAVTTNFKAWDAKVGIGICLKSKK